MSKIDWIGSSDDPAAAAAYINAKAPHTEGILVFTKNKDETFSFNAFGDMKMTDVAAAGALLSYQASKQLYEG